MNRSLVLVLIVVVITTLHIKGTAGLLSASTSYTVLTTPSCGAATGSVKLDLNPTLLLNLGSSCTIYLYGEVSVTQTSSLLSSVLCLLCFDTTFTNVPVGTHKVTCTDTLLGLITLDGGSSINITVGSNDIVPSDITSTVTRQCGPAGSPGRITATTPWGSTCPFPSTDYTQTPSCVFVDWAQMDPSSAFWSPLASTDLDLTDLYAGNYSLTLTTNIGRCTSTWYFQVDPPPTTAVTAVGALAPVCPGAVGSDLLLTATCDLVYLGVASLDAFTISVSTLLGWQTANYTGAGPFTIPMADNVDTDYQLFPADYPFCVFNGIAPAGGSLLANFTAPDQTTVTNVTANPGLVNLSGIIPTGQQVNWTQGGTWQLLLDSQPYQVAAAGLVQATYTVNTCEVTSDFTVYQEFVLNAVNQTISSCSTSGTGLATFEIFGGVPPFDYTLYTLAPLTPVASGPVLLPPLLVLSSLPADSYQLTIRDATLAARSAAFTIASANLMVLHTQLDIDYHACPVSTNLTAWATGGSGTYSYNATVAGGVLDGANFVLSGLAAGESVLVTAVDALGCVMSASLVIPDPGLPFSASLASTPAPVCQGQAVGAASLALSYLAASPYSMSDTLINTATNAVVRPSRVQNRPLSLSYSGLLPGSYRAELTPSGCALEQQTLSFTVAGLITPQLTVTSVFESACGGVGSISGTTTLSTGSYTLAATDKNSGQVVWQQVLTSSSWTIADLLPGTYLLAATNDNSCASLVLNQTISNSAPTGFQVSVINSTAASRCWYGRNGSITFSLTNGVPPYRWRISFVGNNLTSQGNYTSALQTVASASAIVTLSELPVAGRYVLQVSDSNLLDVCSASIPLLVPGVATPDEDGDGICDVADNCVLVANFNQSDVDNDGIGDLCDVCPLNATNTLDSDGDGTPDCLDQCPFTPTLVNQSSCGCVPEVECGCLVADSCDDLVFVAQHNNQTTTTTFYGNRSVIGVRVVRGSNNRTVESLLEWSTLTEFDGQKDKVIKVLELSNLTWTRAVLEAADGVVAEVTYRASHQFPGAQCPFEIVLVHRFAAANSSTTDQGITFYFYSPGTKFSLHLLGCWGFAKPSNKLFATFQYVLPDSHFVAPPENCDGEAVSPASPIGTSRNATGKYQTVSLHTARGGVVQTQVLTVAEADGATVKVRFRTLPLRGQIRLQLPSFTHNLTYDPTLMLLFGRDIGTSGSDCTTGVAWIGPLVAFGVAMASILVTILVILYFPPANRLFLGKEGKRVNRVREKGERLSGHMANPLPEPATAPSPPSATTPPPGLAFVTTENW